MTVCFAAVIVVPLNEVKLTAWQFSQAVVRVGT
jgi:hypothetical protein